VVDPGGNLVQLKNSTLFLYSPIEAPGLDPPLVLKVKEVRL